RELIDPSALADLELELQSMAEGRRAHHADDLHDVLRRVGDLTEDELVSRASGDLAGWTESLLAERRAIRIRIAGEDRIAAVEEAGRLRDALGASIPRGGPAAFAESGAPRLRGPVARSAP